MKISTRSRYGLRFMLELAAGYGKRPLYLKDIAHSQEISEKYLTQIVVDLKATLIIDGFRGVHGDYVLAKAPSKITAYDLVSVLEGDLALVECARNPTSCTRTIHCVNGRLESGRAA